MTGDDLRRERQAAGLTQVQLAGRIGRGLRTLKRWEAGQAPIPDVALPLIAKALRREPVAMGHVTGQRASEVFDETAVEWEIEADQRSRDGDPEGAERALRFAEKHRQWAQAARASGKHDPLADQIERWWRRVDPLADPET